jgi:hypothetical protein
VSNSGPATDTPFREAVRMRPGMYVGDITGDGANDGVNGLLVMLLEVVGNALDQHLLGRCTAIQVEVDDDVITVRDDGPGLPRRTPTRSRRCSRRLPRRRRGDADRRTAAARCHRDHVVSGASAQRGQTCCSAAISTPSPPGSSIQTSFPLAVRRRCAATRGG